MKNVLIITYYWPPSGGGGVQRWLKFAKYLPGEGWNCIVFTPENPSFDQKDHSLEKEVHPDTEVLKLPIWEPYSLFKFLKGEKTLDQGVTPAKAGKISKFIRGNLLIPDPRIFWVKPAVKFLSNYLHDRKVDIIVTTGPPHSMHLIGRKLHRKLNIPWVADFRDPWSRWDMIDEFGLTGIARRMHKKLERKVIQEASGIITVSSDWQNEFYEDHGVCPKVITNGFDPDDFPADNKKSINTFTLVHAGLLNAFRNAPALWQVCSEFFRQRDIEGKVVLRGMIDVNVKQELQRSGLSEFLDTGSSISHTDVIDLYQNSAVLLLLINRTDNSTGHIPGKLFEYLAANRWIIAIGDVNGATSRILDKTGHGSVVDWDDYEGMKKVLIQYYNYFLQDKIPDPQTIEEFSRDRLTKTLAHYLDGIVDPD